MGSIDQFETLVDQVEQLREKDPVGYKRKNPAKVLAAIIKLAFEVIPQDPTNKNYQQGNTLGKAYKNWCRAKFFQQYRLFFRYSSTQRVIILGWVNDKSTKRAYEN